MNAVEIEEAVSKLVEEPIDGTEFPYAFLEAFGNKTATIQRLRSTGKNTTNKTDATAVGVVAVLQRNNIHIATVAPLDPVSWNSLYHTSYAEEIFLDPGPKAFHALDRS